MQDIRADTKKRGPSSRVLQEVIRQASSEYVTVGWLTSTLHRDSFGVVMLCLGLLATTPVGSTVPGLILAVMAVQLIVGRGKPAFPHFIMTRRDAEAAQMACARPSNLKKDLTTKIDTLDIFQPRLATRQARGRCE